MKIFNRNKEIISVDAISPLTFLPPAVVPFAKNKAAEEVLEKICYQGLLKVLLQLGIEGEESALPVSKLREAIGIVAGYDRLFETLMGFLDQAGYIKRETGRITLPDGLKQELAGFHVSDTVNRLVDANTEYRAYGNLIKVCLESLQNILTGKVPATDIIFPAGSFELVSGIYGGNYQADYFNELLADMVLASVADGVRHLQQGKKIRLLEIGAGTGGSSVMIFSKLAPYQEHIEYVYTDVSRSFLLYAEEHFKVMAPYLKTALFNIEQQPQSQNIQVGAFDIVIGTNVVHATKNIALTLQNIKPLLKRDGLLMLSEIAATDLFTSLTFGLLDGWWLYEDKEIRLEGSPGLSAESWFDVLAETGFGEPSSWPRNTAASQQVIVAKSNGDIMIERGAANGAAEKNNLQKQAKVDAAGSDVHGRAEAYLKKVFSHVLKLNEELIDVEASFESLGIDSIFVGMLAKEISKDFGSVPATAFFEHTNISELAEYFTEHHTAYFETAHQNSAIIHDVIQDAGIPPAEVEQVIDPEYTAPVQPESEVVVSQPVDTQNAEDGIAIIGLSGRYPGARNIEAFWENLKAGVDSISTIPADRFDIDRFYDEEKGKEGKISTRYGGFIDGVTEFDPVFFNIPVQYAERMDPQERLFLQTVWETIEDAGYTPKQLSQRAAKDRTVKTGVYVGVMYEEYQLLGVDDDRPILLGSSPASIANRVSYFCDFSGPSMAIDTMCSSSLTTIHLACNDLRSGEADIAIAGGVNVSIHPTKFMALSQATFLSAKGRCESFGNNGDGFIPGEGVGAVLLKPLHKAIADGDHIYGVIRGSAVNHGGRNNGYTVPGVKGQAAVIKEAMDKAKVSAEDFSYIEAHGTGTSLGDPIEFTGLTRALKTDKRQYCSLGSVKSNIGHCESAAGIAGVTKILLQLQHQQLAPSLHSSELNVNIDFINSPFKVQQHLAAWTTENNRLRLAGISSFGAGGSNAHIIIEEYRAPQQVAYTQQAPAVIVVSAKNSNRLREQVINIKKWLASNAGLNLYNIAYTLQTGREAMEERLAFAVKNTTELLTLLDTYLKGTGEGLYSGNTKKDKRADSLQDQWNETDIEGAIERKDSDLLARMWVKGLSIDWALLYAGSKPSKISLPTYPFAREHCWVKLYGNKPVEINKPPVQPQASASQTKPVQALQEIAAVSGETSVLPEMIFTPSWEPLDVPTQFVSCGGAKHVIITGGLQGGLVQRLQDVLTGHTEMLVTDTLHEVATGITDLYFLQGLLPGNGLTPEEGIEQKELSVFHTIQSLLSAGYGEKALNMTFFLRSTQKVLAADKVTVSGSGIIGLAGSLAREQYLWNIRVIDLEAGVEAIDFSKVLSVPFDKERSVTGYRGDKVYQKKMYPALLAAGKKSALCSQGVYVILGGAGGIGKVTTEYLVKEYGAQVIWLGRSPLNEKIIELQEEVAEWGVKPVYISCNANDRQSVQRAYEEVIASYPSINGLFHSAIVLNDMLLKNMSEADFKKSFDPKSIGSHHFIEVFARQPLDFICFYSSVESQSSAPGQANYAAGCTYKDAYAQSIGGSITTPVCIINWGYWGEVGVAAGETYKAQFELMGIGSISGDEGMDILELVLSNKTPQVLAIKLLDMERPAVSNIVADKNNQPQTAHTDQSPANTVAASIDMRSLTGRIAKIAADTIGIAVEEFDAEESFMDYGLDSITGRTLVKCINEALGISLRPTDIFSHPNVAQLSVFIGKTFAPQLNTENGLITQVLASLPEVPLGETGQIASKKTKQVPAGSGSVALQDIAIIGMSGQFGGANNLEEYWEALREGRSLIEEVPAERWDLQKYYNAGKSAPGKTHSKWGGFIKDIDKFDPLFFKISGEEAETMDPQQRLFLMHCWKAIEDAAINPRNLKGGKCGVYVGVGPGDYLTTIEDLPASAMWGNSNAIIASRISYLLDLKGPAISIDAACSSSLVAMDMGCSSLQRGDTDVVISGAVTIMNTSNFYTLASKAGMLSPDGACYTFDSRANGFVPGEGVGVVIMKRLEDAERDGDHIYGVIKGSMTNQDGATNGIFAPSALSQQELEQNLYTKYNIHPESISYVEAHGTGTSLGDPIEFEALSAAFRSFTAKKQFCGLGSVKTNIGHTLLAAGMAGVMKVLLSLKHKQLPPTLNYREPNVLIDINNSPFKIQQQLEDWTSVGETPRRAAISSFGFSGTNAHMVIEEYQAISDNQYTDTNPVLIVLSAKNTDRLKDQAAKLKIYLEANPAANIYDVAYTLQTGREAMEERLAAVVSSTKELLASLNGYLNGTQNDIETGSVKKNNFSLFLAGEAGKAYIDIAVKNKEYKMLAGLWVRGSAIDWNLLYRKDKPKRISLPTYPFAMDRYWLTPVQKAAGVNGIMLHTGNGLPEKIRTIATTDDLAIMQNAGERAGAVSRAEIINRLVDLFARGLKLPAAEIKEDIDLQEYGIDSISTIKLLQQAEEQFSVELEVSELMTGSTIAHLAAIIEARLNSRIAATAVSKEGRKTGAAIELNPNLLNKEQFENNYTLIPSLRRKSIAYKEIKLEVFMGGYGKETMVLLPPVDCTAVAWMAQLEELQKKYRILILNYPGYGLSEFQASLATLSEIARAVIHTLELLKIREKVHLVGWSMGGFIAQILAVNYAEYFSSLVLVNTTSKLESAGNISGSSQMFEDLRKDFTGNLFRLAATPFAGIDESSIKGSFNQQVSLFYALQVTEHDYRQKVENITIPTLIVSGGRDSLTPPRYSAYLHQQISGSEYTELKSAQHYIPLFHARFFNQRLLKFLAANKVRKAEMPA